MARLPLEAWCYPMGERRTGDILGFGRVLVRPHLGPPLSHSSLNADPCDIYNNDEGSYCGRHCLCLRSARPEKKPARVLNPLAPRCTHRFT